MILHLTFKTPDVVSDAIKEAVDRQRELDRENGCEEDQDGYDDLAYDIHLSLKGWFPGGEYVHVQVDTEEGTATVIKKGA